MKQLLLIILFISLKSQIFAQNEEQILDSLFSSIYTKNEPGAAVAVIKKGEVVFSKGYGVADLISNAPITTGTNFNICSLTKQFTAYCILKLADEKRLSIDDRIEKFFPDFNPKVAMSVTIRQLLSHSSGIVDHYDYADKSQFTEFRDRDVLNTIKSADSLYFPTGSAYRYSNTAFCLLSLIIEKVSGESFPDYLRKNIFEPLRMEKSDVIHRGCRIPDRALGYSLENNTFRISDEKESLFFSTMGDGGIYTSIDDYLKWIMAIQNRKTLNYNIIKEAQSSRTIIDKTRDLSYGFGWFVGGTGERKVVYHTGSNGGFRTIIFTIPSSKYAVIIFSNRTGVDLEDLVRVINRIFRINDGAFVKLESLIS